MRLTGPGSILKLIGNLQKWVDGKNFPEDVVVVDLPDEMDLLDEVDLPDEVAGAGQGRAIVEDLRTA